MRMTLLSTVAPIHGSGPRAAWVSILLDTAGGGVQSPKGRLELSQLLMQVTKCAGGGGLLPVVRRPHPARLTRLLRHCCNACAQADATASTAPIPTAAGKITPSPGAGMIRALGVRARGLGPAICPAHLVRAGRLRAQVGHFAPTINCCSIRALAASGCPQERASGASRSRTRGRCSACMGSRCPEMRTTFNLPLEHVHCQERQPAATCIKEGGTQAGRACQ